MEQEALFEGVGTPAAARQVVRDKERHAVFVREMVKTDNQTQSALTAGFGRTERSAATQGSRLMQDPVIVRAIRHERARVAMLTPDLSVERLLQELGCIALADRRSVVDESGKPLGIHELDEPTARAVAAIDVDEVETTNDAGTRVRRSHRIRLHDKRASIELIARIKGYMAADKVELSGKVSLESLVTGESEDAAA